MKIFKKVFTKAFIFLFLFAIHSVYGQSYTFSPNASYEACFTPGQNCVNEIIQEINKAKQNIYVQAYSFTSKPLAKALVQAKIRGKNVWVILDKKSSDQDKNHRRTLNYLLANKIPIYLDKASNIAHNKVMIIDNETVITGSFNFTWSAQNVNAENVLIIHDKGVVAQYLRNWQKRLAASQQIK